MGDTEDRQRGDAGSFHRARVLRYRGPSFWAAECRLSWFKQHGLVAAEVRERIGIAALREPPGATTLIAKVGDAASYGFETTQYSGKQSIARVKGSVAVLQEMSDSCREKVVAKDGGER